MSGDQRFRTLPAVHKLMALACPQGSAGLAAAARTVLARERLRLRAQPQAQPQSSDDLARALQEELERWRGASLPRVVNATGVVLHTNLGRAVLADAARQAVLDASGACALEISLETGERGERDAGIAQRLCRWTGAEEALVVNNNAAAVLLALAGLGGGGAAVISRGELVEIGGSFRVPDVLQASGMSLAEVGTTNRTHLRDYRAALEAGATLLLRVHRSNFHIEGFSHQVPLAELVELGKEFGVPVVYDLGSGLLEGGSPGEPGIQDALRAGVDLLTFSGDKLLGGPQAGLLLGKKDALSRLRTHPFKRALRAGKLTLAALDATLQIQLGELPGPLPVASMLSARPSALAARARSLEDRLRQRIPELEHFVELGRRRVEGRIGGGSEPQAVLRSHALTLRPLHGGVEEWVTLLRAQRPAVVGRVQDGALLLDMRTLRRGDGAAVLAAVSAVVQTLTGREAQRPGG